MDILRELENLHWEAQRLVNSLEEHSWSRQITRYDSNFVNNLAKKFQDYSNRLYNIREELKGRQDGRA